MYAILRLFLIAALAVLSGCADYNWRMPGVYRIDIQQGNVIEQSMLDQLRQGMDKSQIRYIMGTPVIIDPFHTDRWEYLYSYDDGGAFERREQRHITLHFNENERLSHVSGDVEIGDPSLRAENNEQEQQPESFIVPKRSKPGFLGGLFGDDTADLIEAQEKRDKAEAEAETEAEQQRRTEENIKVIQDPDDPDSATGGP